MVDTTLVLIQWLVQWLVEFTTMVQAHYRSHTVYDKGTNSSQWSIGLI